MSAPLHSTPVAAGAAPPLPDTDEYRVVVYDHGTGETLADTPRRGLVAARRRALSLHRRHGGEVARVLLRGFAVGYVVNGEWCPVDKAVRT